jgi:hypothetical protein
MFATNAHNFLGPSSTTSKPRRASRFIADYSPAPGTVRSNDDSAELGRAMDEEENRARRLAGGGAPMRLR